MNSKTLLRWLNPLIYLILIIASGWLCYGVYLAWADYFKPDCITKRYASSQQEEYIRDLPGSTFGRFVSGEKDLEWELGFWKRWPDGYKELNFCQPSKLAGKPFLIFLQQYGGYILFTTCILFSVWLTTKMYGVPRRWFLAHLWQSSLLYILGVLMVLATVTGNYAPIVFVMGVVAAGAVILNFFFVFGRYKLSHHRAKKIT